MSERTASPKHPSRRRGYVLRVSGLAMIAAFSLALPGCKSTAKGVGSATPSGPAPPVKAQCENLLQIVQTGRAKFDSTPDSADFEKDTRQSALLLQELRDDISKSDVRDDGLKKIAADYQASLSAAAADLTALAAAAKSSDDKKVDSMSRAFDAHWKGTTAVDAKLTAYCAGK